MKIDKQKLAASRTCIVLTHRDNSDMFANTAACSDGGDGNGMVSLIDFNDDEFSACSSPATNHSRELATVTQLRRQ